MVETITFSNTNLSMTSSLLNARRYHEVTFEMRKFAKFLTANVIAAYAPLLFWMPAIPSQVSPWVPVVSPIMGFLFILDVYNQVVWGAVLAVFFILVVILSACFHRSEQARLLVPSGPGH